MCQHCVAAHIGIYIVTKGGTAYPRNAKIFSVMSSCIEYEMAMFSGMLIKQTGTYLFLQYSNEAWPSLGPTGVRKRGDTI